MSDLLTDREGTLEPLVEDRCRYITGVDSFEWLAVSTATIDIEFHIEEPTGFTEYCLALAARGDPGMSSSGPRDRDDPLAYRSRRSTALRSGSWAQRSSRIWMSTPRAR